MAEIFPRNLAAMMVDLVRGAPIGTTDPKDVPYYSPSIMYAYQFLTAARGGTDGKPKAIAQEIVDAFIEKVNRRIESLGVDAARERYAHTKTSGWTREAAKAGTVKAMGAHRAPAKKKATTAKKKAPAKKAS